MDIEVNLCYPTQLVVNDGGAFKIDDTSVKFGVYANLFTHTWPDM